MIDEIKFGTQEAFNRSHLEELVKYLEETSRLSSKPLRILDLATGGNAFNPLLAQSLRDRRISYELVLSDVSPTYMAEGYAGLEEVINEEELQNIRCVLVNNNNLKEKLKKVPIYSENDRKYQKIEKVLKDPKFRFLLRSYKDSQSLVTFDDESFDAVIGIIPYTSMQEHFLLGDFSSHEKAIKESFRILKVGGYHMINEWQVERINPKAFRTRRARKKTKKKEAEIIKARLDLLMTPILVLSNIHEYRTSDNESGESLQSGDLVKDYFFVHKK